MVTKGFEGLTLARALARLCVDIMAGTIHEMKRGVLLGDVMYQCKRKIEMIFNSACGQRFKEWDFELSFDQVGLVCYIRAYDLIGDCEWKSVKVLVWADDDTGLNVVMEDVNDTRSEVLAGVPASSR